MAFWCRIRPCFQLGTVHQTELSPYLSATHLLSLQCHKQDGTDAEARRRRARLLGLADGNAEGEGDDEEGVIAGTDRLQRLDFSWRPEDEVDTEAAAAAVAAEQAARQKRQQLQRLTKQARESQQVGWGCGWSAGVLFCV